jgi:carbamate kinase
MAEFRTKVPIDAEAIPSPQFMNMARDKKFMSHKKTVVIALGGNALLRAGESLSQANQAKNVKMAVSSIAEVARENKWNIILTHGNGPQVGFLALQQEAFGLDVLTAETQGMIGCQLDEGLSNELPDK